MTVGYNAPDLLLHNYSLPTMVMSKAVMWNLPIFQCLNRTWWDCLIVTTCKDYVFNSLFIHNNNKITKSNNPSHIVVAVVVVVILTASLHHGTVASAAVWSYYFNLKS